MSKFLQNLNGNLLAAVDCETTGFKPGHHDLIQVAVIVLDGGLEPSREHLPFIMDLKPKRPENECDPEAMRINRVRYCDIATRGMDAYDAADRFVEWFERLRLPMYKKICPLACNWPFDREFITAWLGRETFDMVFHPHYRDVMQTAVFLNDRAGWRGERFPYPKANLGYLCTEMKIERTRAHEAVDDARVTAEVYRRLVQESL